MKFALFIALSAFPFFVSAQSTQTIDSPATSGSAQPPAVSNSMSADITMKVDSQGFVVVLIPQSKLKEARKDWMNYAAKGSKGKSVSNNGDEIQYAVVNKNIAPDPFDLSARLLETIEGVRLTVWFTSSSTLQSSKEQMRDRDLALQKYVRDFAVMEYRMDVQDELKAAKSKQIALENQLNRSIKDKERSEKRIEENKRSIQHANDAIATGKLDIQSISAKIETQKAMVDNTASDANATKGAKKTLNELENEKRSLQKQNDINDKKIDNWNKEIKEEERAIEGSKEKQGMETAAIENQKQSVQQVQTKLDGIK